MKKIYYLLPVLFCGYAANAQWNSNVALNLEIAAQETADLQTATTADGKTWIAYYHHNGSNYDMRAQLLASDGTKLLGPDGALISNLASGSAIFVFNVCLDASDNLIVAFQYQVAGVMRSLVSKISTSGNLLWGAAGIELGAGLAPYPAVLTTGETVVAWSNTSPSTLYIQKVSASGMIAWATPVSVLVGTSLTTRGQLIASPGGNFTMVFQRKGFGISTTPFVQRYTNEGVAVWAAPVQLSTQTTSGARYYSILAENDTTYFGYYASAGSRFNSFVQRINPDGSIPWGPNGAAFSTYSGSEPSQQGATIAKVAGSGFLWAVSTYSNSAQSQYGVYVQKFATASGAGLLDPLGKEVYPITSNLERQAGNLALVNNNPVFMTYDLNYKIYATRLDDVGNFVWAGNKIEISNTTAGGATPKGRFAFTPIINGQAVAAWYENRGISYRAYAQNVGETGTTGPLPVSLTGFTASRNGTNIDLKWYTLSESNNAGFYIERSGNGVSFNEIGFVSTKASGGNSVNKLQYFFTHVQALTGTNYYRLKQVDRDGKKSYSKVILIKQEHLQNLIIGSIVPNPVKDRIIIDIESATPLTIKYSITDMGGKIITANNVSIIPGSNKLQINTSKLSGGSYIIKLFTGNGKINAQPFIKD